MAQPALKRGFSHVSNGHASLPGITTHLAPPRAVHLTSSAPQHLGNNPPMPGRPDQSQGLARTVCGFHTLYKAAEDPGES
jgi:hypothetical protein